MAIVLTVHKIYQVKLIWYNSLIISRLRINNIAITTLTKRKRTKNSKRTKFENNHLQTSNLKMIRLRTYQGAFRALPDFCLTSGLSLVDGASTSIDSSPLV